MITWRAGGQTLMSDKKNTVISINHLNKTYRSNWSGKSEIVLEDISIDFHEQEILGIVGMSGSGKTTLLRCILQLVRPDNGSVSFKGLKLTDMNETELRTQVRPYIRFIYQHPEAALNPGLTIHDILYQAYALFHKESSDSEIESRITSIFQDIDFDSSYAGKYPHELSGGEKRRVALARALATEPEILFADEPFAGLDKVLQYKMLELIIRLKSRYKLTIVMVSHDTDIMKEVCDKLIILHEGKILEIVSTPWKNPVLKHDISKKLLISSF